MTWGIFSIGWLDLSDEAKASELFTRSYLPYVRQPFKVNQTVLHIKDFTEQRNFSSNYAPHAPPFPLAVCVPQ